MKKILFSLAFIGAATLSQAQWSQDFEKQDVFSVDNVSGWTFIDLDGGKTFSIEVSDNHNNQTNVEFPNSTYIGTAIVFDHTQTNPPLDAAYAAHNGNKSLYFIAAGQDGTAHPNDDWAILPQVTLGENSEFSFWGKSLTDSYGLERFQIAISTTGKNPEDFTVISEGAYVEAPTEWTKFTYDLSNYNGQQVYIALHYIADDSFILLTDEFAISKTLSVKDVHAKKQSALYPNPVKDFLTVTLSEDFNAKNTQISITGVTGKQALKVNYTPQINVANLTPGVYVLSITDGKKVESHKFVKK